MDDEKIEVSDEVLENISPEELIDLKIEIDDLISKLNNIGKLCDETLKS